MATQKNANALMKVGICFIKWCGLRAVVDVLYFFFVQGCTFIAFTVPLLEKCVLVVYSFLDLGIKRINYYPYSTGVLLNDCT